VSAWLCDPYHVGRLSQWLCMRTDRNPRGRFRGLSHALQPDVSGAAYADPLRAPDGIDGDPVGECAAAVAVILGRANVASIEERYGDRAARIRPRRTVGRQRVPAGLPDRSAEGVGPAPPYGP